LGTSDHQEVDVVGWNLPQQARLPVVPFGASIPAGQLELEAFGDMRDVFGAQLGFVYADGFAGAARVRQSSHAVESVVAPTDAGSPMTLDPPTSITGQLRQPGQRDAYRIGLKKDQQVVIVVESPSLGLPMVPVVRLMGPDDAAVAEVLETGPPQDAILQHTAAQDGEYRLLVSDRYRHGGDRYFYRLNVMWQESAFFSMAAADSVVAHVEKPGELPLTVQRQVGPEGPLGPITIEPVDLPPGVSAPAVVSEPTGPTATAVTLKFSTTGQAFSGPIRIRATVDQPRPITRFVRSPAIYSASFESIWLTAMAKP
jgi:hypothetical protein